MLVISHEQGGGVLGWGWGNRPTTVSQFPVFLRMYLMTKGYGGPYHIDVLVDTNDGPRTPRPRRGICA